LKRATFVLAQNLVPALFSPKPSQPCPGSLCHLSRETTQNACFLSSSRHRQLRAHARRVIPLFLIFSWNAPLHSNLPLLCYPFPSPFFSRTKTKQRRKSPNAAVRPSRPCRPHAPPASPTSPSSSCWVFEPPGPFPLLVLVLQPSAGVDRHCSLQVLIAGALQCPLSLITAWIRFPAARRVFRANSRAPVRFAE
jgi:hypothetical protein